MIDIRIDGLSVELAADSALQLSLVNPHFDYAKIPGSTASLPTFPLSRRNQYIFGYWEQPQAGAVLQRRRFEQYWNGHLIREALFVLTQAGPTGYVGQMVEPLGEFFGDWQNELLTDLNLGTLPIPALLTPQLPDASGRPAVAFPTIVDPDFYGTNGPSINYSGLVNEYKAGAYTADGPKVPMVLLGWLLQQIARATNTTIDGPFLAHGAYAQLLLYNTRALDDATQVTINRHLPAMTIPDLLLELRKLFNLRFDFDTNRRSLTIGFWQDALKKPAPQDWSKKAVGRGVKTPEINTRLQLGYDLDGGDQLMKDKPPILSDYVTPGSTSNFAPLKSRFSTLLMDDTTGTAKAAQAGITALFGQLSNTFAPRLLFWGGLVGGLPLATSALGGYSLYWNGGQGLYANHWRELEAMRGNQFYTTQSFDLTETDLAMLRFGDKVHVAGVDYFVLSVDVSLPIQGPAQCLLVAG